MNCLKTAIDQSVALLFCDNKSDTRYHPYESLIDLLIFHFGNSSIASDFRPCGKGLGSKGGPTAGSWRNPVRGHSFEEAAVRRLERTLGVASLCNMDAWSAEFPLPPYDRAQAPDLDIDSLLDFASQSLLRPCFEPPGALKAPPSSFKVASIPCKASIQHNIVRMGFWTYIVQRTTMSSTCPASHVNYVGA